MRITSAPSSYPHALPHNVSSNIAPNGRFGMNSLPSGDYTFEAVSNCGVTVSDDTILPVDQL